ncbi:P-loop containing nucleoside triphosphatehydrolases superfamily protein, partial [Striga asiatica]
YIDQNLPIHKLRLHIWNPGAQLLISFLDQWIADCNIKVFKLSLSFTYDQPWAFFFSESLEELHLRECKLSPVESVRFKSLRTLTLERVQVDCGTFETKTLGCPLLTRLVLNNCRELRNVRLSEAPGLKHFELFDSERREGGSIEIDVPNLETCGEGVDEGLPAAGATGHRKVEPTGGNCQLPQVRCVTYLASLYINSVLIKRQLLSTNNRLMIVIEDVDCSTQMHDREGDSDDDYYYNKEPRHRYSEKLKQNFVSFVDGTLQRYLDQNLSLHKLHLDFSDPNSPPVVSLLDKWIPIIAALNIKAFKLNFHKYTPPYYNLPSAVFFSESLEELHLNKCRLSPVESVRFQNLRTLTLERVQCGEGVEEGLPAAGATGHRKVEPTGGNCQLPQVRCVTYLASLYINSVLIKRQLLSTNNRLMIVIEDVDCSTQMHDRDGDSDYYNNEPRHRLKANRNSIETCQTLHHLLVWKQLTLLGMLNFIDGLWSSSGDERIIIFTTNYKEKLDPAFFEIKELIREVEITPTEIAEQLMRNEDPDLTLEGVLDLLKQNKEEKNVEIKKTEAKKDEICGYFDGGETALNIKAFKLDFLISYTPPYYNLPSAVFFSESLEELHLNKCRLSSVESMQFKSLRTLTLERVQVDGGTFDTKTLGCPLLIRLVINDCWELRNVRLSKVPGLKHFVLFDSERVESRARSIELDNYERSIEINVMNLE